MKQVLFLKQLLNFLWVAVGMVLIGALPALFDGTSVNFAAYFNGLFSIIQHLLHPSDLVYTNVTSGVEKSLFPEFLQPYSYSLQIYFAAFFLSFAVALLFTCAIIFLKKKQIRIVKYLVFLFESLPDVVVIFLAQLFVVWFAQKTDILLINFASAGQDYAYLLPIVTLSILPGVFFFRIMLMSFEEEFEEPYVDFAKNKGSSKPVIVFGHVLRNAMMTILNHANSILWLMLANLVMLEYLFNMYGITQFMFTNYSPEIFTTGLLMLFLPIFLVQSAAALIVGKVTGEGGELHV